MIIIQLRERDNWLDLTSAGQRFLNAWNYWSLPGDLLTSKNFPEVARKNFGNTILNEASPVLHKKFFWSSCTSVNDSKTYKSTNFKNIRYGYLFCVLLQSPVRLQTFAFKCIKIPRRRYQWKKNVFSEMLQRWL